MSSTTEITQAPRRLLRLKQVLDRTGLPKSTMYSRISAGTFPKTDPRWVVGSVVGIGGRSVDQGASG